MRIFSVGNVVVKCSPFLLLLIPLLVVCGAVGEMLTAFLSLTLHELCHTMIAHGLGYGIASVEIQPFGFVARLADPIRSSWDELAIAAAGPVCSFVMAAAAASVAQETQGVAIPLMQFARFNLVLAAVNLLPALPLDGGRIVRALLTVFFRPRVAVTLCAVVGILSGLGLLLLGILSGIAGDWNLSATIMGLFLAIAATREMRSSRGAQLNAMVQRSAQLRNGEGIKTVQIALHMSATAGAAMRSCSAGRYNIILVVDDSMRIQGRLDEGDLLWGIAKYGRQCMIGELIKRLH